MHAPVLICINQHAKFEMLSFTDSKDTTGAKLKTDHMTLTQGRTQEGADWAKAPPEIPG